MNRDPLDHSLTGWLADQSSTPTYFEEAMARTRHTRQRPAWSFPERWLPMQLTMRPVYVPRQFFYLALVGLLMVVVAFAAARDRRRSAGRLRRSVRHATGSWRIDQDGSILVTSADRGAAAGGPDDDRRRVRPHLRARRHPSRVLRSTWRGRRPVRGGGRRQPATAPFPRDSTWAHRPSRCAPPGHRTPAASPSRGSVPVDITCMSRMPMVRRGRRSAPRTSHGSILPGPPMASGSRSSRAAPTRRRSARCT